MNLILQPSAGIRLLATAVAMPLDLPPAGRHGIALDNDAVHEAVLGPDWRAQLAAQTVTLGTAASATMQAVRHRQHVREANAIDLAIEAARRALLAAGMQADDLAALICVTSSPPLISAAMAARVGRALGCSEALCNATAFDVRAGGVGVMLAWFSAQGLIAQGSGPVLVVAAEAPSSFMRPDDLATALLYGDGAAACILAGGQAPSDTFLGGMSGQVALQGRPTTIPGLLPPQGDLMAYRFDKPDRAHLADLSRLWDQCPRVLVAQFPQACARTRWLVPYAVSERQMATAHAALGQPDAELVHELARYGCVGAASPLVALHGLLASGRTRPGDVVALLSAAGNGVWAGFFWALQD